MMRRVSRRRLLERVIASFLAFVIVFTMYPDAYSVVRADLTSMSHMLKGVVTNKVTGEPIVGATVLITNKQSRFSEWKGYTSQTNENGEYAINDLYDTYDYVVTVTHNDYNINEDSDTTFAIPSNETEVVRNFALTSDKQLEFEDDEYEVFLIEKDDDDFSSPEAEKDGVKADKYSSSDTDVATVNESDGTLTLLKAGETTITAQKEGYLNVSYRLVVKKKDQEIQWANSLPEVITWEDGEAGIDCAVKDAGEGCVIKYNVEGSDATIDQKTGKVTFTELGDVTVTAYSEGNDYYNESETIETSFTVKKAKRNIVINVKIDDPDIACFGKGELSAEITDEDEKFPGAEVLFRMKQDGNNEQKAKITGNQFEPQTSGKMTIEGYVAEDEKYFESVGELTLNVGHASNEFYLPEGATEKESLAYLEDYKIPWQANTSIKYEVSDEDGKYIEMKDKNTVHVSDSDTDPVTVHVTLKADGNEQYQAAENKEIALSIVRAKQTVSVTSPSSIDFQQANDRDCMVFQITAESTASDEDSDKDNNKVSFSLAEESENVTLSSDGKAYIQCACTFSVIAHYSGNKHYEPADSKPFTINVGLATQEIEFSESEIDYYVGDPNNKTVKLTDGIGTGEITYSVDENDIISVDGDGKISILKLADADDDGVIGTFVIHAKKAADTRYQAAEAEYKVTVKYHIPGDDKPYEFNCDEKDGWYRCESLVISPKSGNTMYDGTTKNEIPSYPINEDGEHTVKFLVKEETGIVYYCAFSIQKDITAPTITSVVLNGSIATWESAETFIDKALYDQAEIRVTAQDAIVNKGFPVVQYCIDYDPDAIKTEAQIKQIKDDEWTTGRIFSAEENHKFVAYVRAMDQAGNIAYAHTNIIVFDRTDPENPTVEKGVSPIKAKDSEEEEEDSAYVSNLPLTITAKDKLSGVKKITCQVVYQAAKDNNEFEDPVAVKVTYTDDSNESVTTDKPIVFSVAEDLVYEYPKNIEIPAGDYNGKLTLTVTTEDGCGNVNEYKENFLFASRLPVIDAHFDKNITQVDEDENHVHYFNTDRILRVNVAGMESTFSSLRVYVIVSKHKIDDFTSENAYEVKDRVKNEEDTSVVHPDYHTVKDKKLPFEISAIKTGTVSNGLKPHEFDITFKGNSSYYVYILYKDKYKRIAEPFDGGELFVVDTEVPGSTIYVNEKGKNNQLLSSNELKENEETKENETEFELVTNKELEISFDAHDSYSAIRSVEYYVSTGEEALEYLKKDDLAKKEWTPLQGTRDEKTWKSSETYEVTEEKKFVLYAKITDYSGNVSYVSTCGIVVDKTPVVIKASDMPDGENGYHCKDYELAVSVTDKELEKQDLTLPYSGFDRVEYAIVVDASEEEAEQIVGYMKDAAWKYEVEELLKESRGRAVFDSFAKSDEFEFKHSEDIHVSGWTNNSDNVKVFLRAYDRAGNVTIFTLNEGKSYLPLKFAMTEPKVNVVFKNAATKEDVKNGRAYFKDQTATITVKSRSTLFDYDEFKKLIKISGSNVDGEELTLGDDDVVFTYVPPTSEYPSDEDEHVIKIEFKADANYDFTLSYVDKAGHVCDYDEVTFNGENHKATDRYFTVDATSPTGSITIDKYTWTTLLKSLTFGLWEKDPKKAVVTVKAEDATSPVTIEYYMSDGKAILTADDLDKVEDWKLYNGIDVGEYQRFVIYLRITDKAGNYKYLCSGGYIVDPLATLENKIKITLSDPTVDPLYDMNGKMISLPIYNDDLTAKIEISEQQEDGDEDYSGIKKVEYWIVENEGDSDYPQLTEKELDAKKELLYSYEFTRDTVTEDENGNETTDNINAGTLIIRERISDNEGNGEIKEETLVGSYPEQERLRKDFTSTIKIIASEHNCSNVTLHVGVWDNAGNYTENTMKMDIDVTAPTIEVSYDNDNANKMDKDRGYFPADRTATIVITERTDHFEQLVADGGITITAVNAKGEGVPVIAKVIGKDKGKIEIVPVGNASEPGTVNLTTLGDIWKTVKKYDESGDKKVPVPDGDTHTLIIHYDADANYEFSIKYADKATNPNQEVDYGKSVAPNEFTVDRKNPFGEITAKEVLHDDSAAAAQVVREIHTWKDLIKVLTFGIWTKADISVAANWNDETSKTEQAMYYQAPDNKALTSSELDKITGWVSFAEFELEPNAQRTVYLRVTDYAGNRTYISTNAMILDNVAPGTDTLQPSIGVAATASADIYSGDVPVSVTVSDPKTDEAFSGLKKVSYIVTNMGTQTQNGILYAAPEVTNNGIDNEAEVGKDENGNPRFFTYEELEKTKSFSGSLTVEAAKNNSNDVRVVVLVEDKAGNTFEKDIRLKIDITKPTISVSYDNNEGDVTFANPATDAYFKAPRTATVVITERNFDPNRVNFTIQNSDGAAPAISGWTTVTAVGNGDGTTHTATIVYGADGDYGFDVGVIDQAGNGNQGVDYGGSLAPQKFTVDRTIPKIAIEYDNNDAKNGNYYKETRTATVTITERNFETSRIRVTMTASDDGTPIPVPVVSAWTNYGERHVALIAFADDARYSLDVDYADKAGNESENMEAQVFYVDLTAPVLRIDNILDESANGGDGDVGFVMTATDVNFESFVPKLTATVREGDGFTTKVLQIGTTEDIKNGKVFTVSNLEDDGIYHVECTLVDKAGNAYEQVILVDKNGKDYVARRSAGDKLVSFSVNRLGSTYELDDATRAIVEKYYLRNLEHDLTLIEINADPLKNRSVTVNGRELTEGTDYTVKESGGKGKWYRYEYVIGKYLFEAEGEYVIVCSSKDKAENDAFNDVKGVNARFVIDRTPPVVAVTGLSEKGRYQTENQVVTIVPTDDGGALKSLVVSLVEKNGEVVGDLLSLEDDRLEQALEENGGALTFTVPEGLYQNVKIVAKDQAGSDEEEPNTYAQTITNVSVTPSGFLIFWANKPARFGAMGGIAAAVALVALLLFWRKKRGYRR